MQPFTHIRCTQALFSIPDTHQWARFCYYAERIRVLVHHGSASTDVPFEGLHAGYHPDTAVDPFRPDNASDDEADDEFPCPTLILPSVWFHLKQLSGGRPLLPALRELEWMTSPFGTEIFDLVSPSLQRIYVRLNPAHNHTDAEWSAHLPLVIRSIAALAPELHQFEIGAMHSNTLRAATPELHKMKHLRYLAVDANCSSGCDIDAPALSEAKLDTIKNLEYLRLGLEIAGDPLAAHSITTLHALRSLAVVDSNGNPKAYRLFSIPSLRSLDATIRSPDTDTSGYRDILLVFTQQFPDISSLALTLDGGRADLIQVIEPLHLFPALRALSLIVKDALATVSNAEVRVLLERAPYLSSLTIDFSPTMIHLVWMVPRADAFLHIAQFGSQLTEFLLSNLRLSEYELDRALPQAALIPPNTRLVVVAVGCVSHEGRSDVQCDLAKCAALVHRLFPNLDLRRCRACPPKSNHWETTGAWNTVLAEIERLRRAAATPMVV